MQKPTWDAVLTNNTKQHSRRSCKERGWGAQGDRGCSSNLFHLFRHRRMRRDRTQQSRHQLACSLTVVFVDFALDLREGVEAAGQAFCPLRLTALCLSGKMVDGL